MKKKILLIIISLILLWGIIGSIDYYRVCHLFERPLFVLATGDVCDDGGSGTYQGLGYSFAINGNFMPEDEFPGVTHYEYHIFGDIVKSGIRD